MGRDEEMTQEGPRYPPASQEQAAYRALCLTGLVFRARFEGILRMSCEAGADAGSGELAGLFARAKVLDGWLSREGLAEYQSQSERGLFGLALGSWEEHELLDASWRAESLGVLLWSLSMLKRMPPYDSEFPEGTAMRYVGWLKPASELLGRARLRDADDILRARDVAELWHWRCRTTRLQQEGYVPSAEVGDLDEVVRNAANLAHRHGDIPAPIEEDFPAFGKAYRDLTEEEYSLATSIAMERHYALNWLCGYSKDWDETPTDT